MIKGSKHSKETKIKIQQSLIGKKASNETKLKLRKSHLGHKHSDETKKKISEALKGNKNPNYGKTINDDVRRKISEKQTGRVVSQQTKKKISEALKRKNAPGWKGGYSSKNIPTYDFFNEKLTIEEKPKRDIKDKNILTVLCAHCKKRFTPTLSSVYERVRALNGKQSGEMRLYCSDQCKNNCNLYRSQTKSYIGLNKETFYNSSDHKQFREHVLKRDNYKCQYCGEKAEHVHHERPQKLEPFYSLDPDLAWSVCKKCHYKYGHKDECSTGKLANKICKGDQ